MTLPAVPPGFGPRHAQPIDKIMSQLETVLGGIDLDNLSIKSPEPSVDDLNAASAAARLAATPDFAVLLEWLADKTVRRAPLPPALGTDPMQAYAHGQRREGQNDVLFLLMALIARGREDKNPAEEGRPA